MLRLLMAWILLTSAVHAKPWLRIELPEIRFPERIIEFGTDRDQYHVSVKNDTQYPIYVAWKRFVKESRHGHRRGRGRWGQDQGRWGQDQGRWRSEGWWRVEPFQETYLGSTETQGVFLYAETADDPRMFQWRGDSWNAVGNREVGMFYVDMRGHRRHYTHRFSFR